MNINVVRDPQEQAAHTTEAPVATTSGYCLWEFDGAEWLLKKDCSKADHKPSAPPASPGSFRGQLKSLLAVPV